MFLPLTGWECLTTLQKWFLWTLNNEILFVARSTSLALAANSCKVVLSCRRKMTMERVGERGVYQFISNVMAEYSTDFNNLDEATTESTHPLWDFRARLPLTQTCFLVQCFQTQNKNLSLPVAKTYTYNGCNFASLSCPKELHCSRVAASTEPIPKPLVSMNDFHGKKYNYKDQT